MVVAGEVDGIECAGNVCVAEANDEKVAGVGCVVDGGAVVADNEAWRFEGCPNRWSVGGDVEVCIGCIWIGNVGDSGGSAR